MIIQTANYKKTSTGLICCTNKTSVAHRLISLNNESVFKGELPAIHHVSVDRASRRLRPLFANSNPIFKSKYYLKIISYKFNDGEFVKEIFRGNHENHEKSKLLSNVHVGRSKTRSDFDGGLEFVICVG